MKDRVLAVLLTLAVFSAGFISGLWAERHRPFPAPPGAFLGEFGARPAGQRHQAPSINRAQLLEQIESLKPQMEEFRKNVGEIYAQFDRDIEPVLTDEQRQTYEKRFRAHRGFGPQPDSEPGTGPLSDEQIEQLMQRPLRTMAYFVVIPMTLERMSSELKLDPAQREKVKDLLRVRREKFIELLDQVPPPSLTLSRLAPLAQRIVGQPRADSPEPAR